MRRSRRPGWLAALAAMAAAACAPKPNTPGAGEPAEQPPVRQSPAVTAPTPAPAAHVEAAAPAPAPEAPQAAPVAPGLREMFPVVRADIAAKLVEFDGIVPINCHDPVTPKVYLELVACTPDTREHEALVMTRAKPSNVHAALLAVGLRAGGPGSWKFENKKLIPVPPVGDGVEVLIAYRDAGGREIECPVVDWVVSALDGSPFAPRASTGPRWVFAGSVIAVRQGREVYDADGTGTLIGLCTFGSEVIAWRDTISPEAAVDEPVWMADPKKVPAAGTPVVVRIRPAAR